jgi:hypothetical protein
MQGDGLDGSRPRRRSASALGNWRRWDASIGEQTEEAAIAALGEVRGPVCGGWRRRRGECLRARGLRRGRARRRRHAARTWRPVVVTRSRPSGRGRHEAERQARLVEAAWAILERVAGPHRPSCARARAAVGGTATRARHDHRGRLVERPARWGSACRSRPRRIVPPSGRCGPRCRCAPNGPFRRIAAGRAKWTPRYAARARRHGTRSTTPGSGGPLRPGLNRSARTGRRQRDRRLPEVVVAAWYAWSRTTKRSARRTSSSHRALRAGRPSARLPVWSRADRTDVQRVGGRCSDRPR